MAVTAISSGCTRSTAPLALEAGATKEALLEKMPRHVLGQGELMGTYER